MLAIKSLQDGDPILGYLRPTKNGVFLKTDNANVLQYISIFVSTIGLRFFFSEKHYIENEKGIREIRKKSISPQDLKYFNKIAHRLTYSPLNYGKFLFSFTEISDHLFQGAKLIADPSCKSDLFELASRPSRPSLIKSILSFFGKSSATKIICSCICGCKYEVSALVCPACKGEDPLGWAWNRFSVHFEKTLAQKLTSILARDVDNEKVVKENIRPLASFLDKIKKKPAVLPEDEKQKAGVLIRYYKELFGTTQLNKKRFSELAQIREKKYAQVTLACVNFATTYRQAWLPSSISGWSPNDQFRQSFVSNCTKVWSQPVVDLQNCYLKIYRSAALYGPIEKSFRSIADRGWLGDVWNNYIRPTLTIISAYSTFGISLIIKAGIELMKSEREQKNYESFAEGLNEAIEASESAINELKNIGRREKEIHKKICLGLSVHLRQLLFADYAKTPPLHQADFVKNWLISIQLPTDGFEKMIPRKTKRPFPTVKWILIGLMILAGLSFLIWMFF